VRNGRLTCTIFQLLAQHADLVQRSGRLQDFVVDAFGQFELALKIGLRRLYTRIHGYFEWLRKRFVIRN